MKTKASRAAAAAASALGLTVLVTAAVAGPAPVPLERALQRPAGQLHGSSSWAKVAVTPPAGAASHWLELDYFVDSELGHDFLKISRSTNGVNWFPVDSLSGARSGRKRLALPPGPCQMRFEYTKDAQGSQGLDVAAVDNVVFGTEGGPYRRTFFDGHAGTVPAGWTPGGAAGGLRIAVPPAVRAVGPGPNPVGTTSMQKTIIFPKVSDNFCVANYFVDSREGHHFFRAYVDLTEVAAVSGRNKSGSLRLVPKAGGPHQIRFTYTKSSVGPEGLDTVRIGEVACSSGGVLFERHSFAGQPLGVAPAGWTVSGFAVQKATPHTSWVPRLAAGESEPVVNGLALDWSEYGRATKIALVNQTKPTERPSDAHLVASSDGQRLYLGLLAVSATAVQGSESGQLTLYVDRDRPATLRHAGCPVQGDAPGPNDRRVSFDYLIAAGGSTATIANLVQMKGNCAGAWVPLAAADAPLGVTTGAVEPLGSKPPPKFLSLEVALDLGASAPGELGFGFVRRVSGVVNERFPYRDDVLQVPVDGDAFSFETVRVGSHPRTTPAATERGFDACCFADD